MLISILMPVYNAGKFLDECLTSISQQQFQHWELIAVDDGSTDDSQSILKQWSKKEARIQVFSQQKTGIIAALRLAYQQSKGELITRMDADDLMPLDKLVLLYEAWQKQPDQLAIGKVSYFSEGALGDGYKRYAAWLNENLQLANPFAQIYRECIIPSCAWLIGRAVFENCGGLESDRYPEDYDLCFRMYENKLQLNVIPNVVHHWRDHPARSSRNDPNYLDNRFLALKLDYFLNLELSKSDEHLVLLGAGKKGKWIAQQLIQKEINFDWETNNDKKVGMNIYNKILKKEKVENWVRGKIIVAVANAEEQQELRGQFKSVGLTEGEEVFFFA